MLFGKEIKAIIFDLDGVVVDSEKVHFEAYQKAFKSVGVHLTQEDYNQKVRAKGRKNGIKNILSTVDEEMNETMGCIKDKHFIHLLESGKIPIFEDALPGIEAGLGAGMKVVHINRESVFHKDKKMFYK